MFPEKRGWGAFGAFSLSGELASEKPLILLRERIDQLFASSDVSPFAALSLQGG